MENTKILELYNNKPNEFNKRIKFRISKGVKIALLILSIFLFFAILVRIITGKGSRSILTKKIKTTAEIFEIRETQIINKYAIYKFKDQQGKEYIDSIFQYDKGYKNNAIGDKIDIIYDASNPLSFHVNDKSSEWLSILIPLLFHKVLALRSLLRKYLSKPVNFWDSPPANSFS